MGLVHFLKFLGLISVSLGVLNLLPIPVLDGGHLFFFCLEGISGRPVSERMQLLFQKIGIHSERVDVDSHVYGYKSSCPIILMKCHHNLLFGSLKFYMRQAPSVH
jgi:hypothetical protein